MIDFVKTTALGNDFILVEKAAVPENKYSGLAQAICDRHFGVGADGVIYWVRNRDVLFAEIRKASMFLIGIIRLK